jgi:hypothetical protein
MGIVIPLYELAVVGVGVVVVGGGVVVVVGGGGGGVGVHYLPD